MNKGPRKHSRKHGESRQIVLDAYRENPRATIRDYVEKAGLAITTVYYHLCRLDKAGVINMRHERGNRTGRYTFKLSQEEISRIRQNAARKAHGHAQDLPEGDASNSMPRVKRSKIKRERVLYTERKSGKAADARRAEDQRIARVVEKANARASDGERFAGMDVVYDFRHSFGIRGSRVG
jgi:predicted ArsR family transcriptional regulator